LNNLRKGDIAFNIGYPCCKISLIILILKYKFKRFNGEKGTRKSNLLECSL
jgi:hypothetical protein